MDLEVNGSADPSPMEGQEPCTEGSADPSRPEAQELNVDSSADASPTDGQEPCTEAALWCSHPLSRSFTAGSANVKFDERHFDIGCTEDQEKLGKDIEDYQSRCRHIIRFNSSLVKSKS